MSMPVFDDDQDDFVDEPVEAEESVAEEAVGDEEIIDDGAAQEPAPAAESEVYSKEAMESAVAAAVSGQRQQYETLRKTERQEWEQAQQRQRQVAMQRQRQAEQARVAKTTQESYAMPTLEQWIEDGGDVGSWKLFNNQQQGWNAHSKALADRLDAIESGNRVRQESVAIENHLERGRNAALKKYPELNTPAWRNRLGNLIYAEAVRISGSNGDIKRLNILPIAKGLSEAIGSTMKSARSKAAKKVASAPGGSPSGSPTKPVRGKGKPKNTEEWLEDGFDELERDLRPRT